MTRLTLDGHAGVTLVMEAWGDPAGPPVVLLHGGGQTRHAWGGTAAAIAAQGWYALSVDLRGHGESDWAPDQDYTMDAFVADLHAVSTSCRQPPVIVGASLGGLVALLAVGESRIRPAAGLVLVDIATRLEPGGAGRIRAFMLAQPEGFASLEDASEAVARFAPHRARPADASGLTRNLRRDAAGRWRWHWDPSFMTGPRPPADVVNTERLEAAARALDVPTLLVRGRLSDVLSEEGAREFLALVPHARYVDVSGAGHMVAGDRNDVFTTAVVDFLRELGG
jgi:pimeloyl-ACP methyl ester carboxylesterase